MYFIIKLAFKKYDVDGDKLFSESELKNYFDKDYMKNFEGIDIDAKFIEGTYIYIKNYDTNKNGISLDELKKAVIQTEKEQKTDNEPHYYPEQ